MFRTLTALFVSAALVPAASADTCTILPIGDSLTEGAKEGSSSLTGGYRTALIEALDDDGLDYALTGVRSDAVSSHSGYRGYRNDDLLDMVSSTPQGVDVVVLLAGTNDILLGEDFEYVDEDGDGEADIVVTLQRRTAPEASNQSNYLIDSIIDRHAGATVLVVAPPPVVEGDKSAGWNGYEAWDGSIVKTHQTSVATFNADLWTYMAYLYGSTTAWASYGHDVRFVDAYWPFAYFNYTDSSGNLANGLIEDGVHLTDVGNDYLAAIIADEIIDACE